MPRLRFEVLLRIAPLVLLVACAASVERARTESESTMLKGIGYVYQSVPDLAKSCKFFTEKLGFKLHTNQRDVKGLAFGSGYLILHVDEPGFRAPVRGAGANVCVLVEDVDAYHALLKERGVQATGLTDRHWGQRDFYVTDPDGYSWCFARAWQ